MGCFGKINNSCFQTVNKLKNIIKKNYYKENYCPSNKLFLDASGSGIIDYCRKIITKCDYSSNLIIKNLFQKITPEVNCINNLKKILPTNYKLSQDEIINLIELKNYTKYFGDLNANIDPNIFGSFTSYFPSSDTFFIAYSPIDTNFEATKTKEIQKMTKTDIPAYSIIYLKGKFYTSSYEGYSINANTKKEKIFFISITKNEYFTNVSDNYFVMAVSLNTTATSLKNSVIFYDLYYDEINDIVYTYSDSNKCYMKYVRCNDKTDFKFPLEVFESEG